MMKRTALPLLMIAALASGTLQAHAQPGAPAQGGGGGGFGGGQGGQNFRNMTPEERQKFMDQQREQQLRTQLNAMNVGTDVQDAIVAFAQTRETALTPLRDQETAIRRALGGPVAADALTKQLADYRIAVQAEKDRRVQAEKDLDTKISYTKNVKLEAFLTVMGLIGDESGVVGGQGGFGGRGGGRGGAGGGFGGGAGGGGGFGGGGFGGGAGGGRRRGGGGGGAAPADPNA